MKFDMTSMDGSAAGSLELRRRDLRSRAARRSSSRAWCAGSSPSARPATTRRSAAARSTAPARRCTSRRAPAAPVTARPACRSSAAAAAPWVRSCAATRMTCRRRCARSRCATRFPPRCAPAGSWCGRSAEIAEGKTKTLRDSFAKASLKNALIIDGARGAREVRRGRAQPAADRRSAGPGRQRLRHHAPREARADQGGDRSAGGAVQMIKDARHYDTIVAPVITEKATHRVGKQPVRLQGRAQRDQAADQGGDREAVRRQGDRGQHAFAQGQDQGFSRRARPAAGHEEGDRHARRRLPHRRDQRAL